MKTAKKAVPRYTHAAAVIVEQIDNLLHVLLAKRPSKGLLAGMWEFPNARVEGNPRAGLVSALRAAYSLKVRVKRASQPISIVEHAYSHFKVTTYAYRCDLSSNLTRDNLKWILLRDLKKYPMGKIDRAIARKL